MPQPNSSASAPFWLHRAKVLAMRINIHHWLARLIPKLSAVLVLTALFDLFRREIGLPGRCSGTLLLFGLGVVAGWAWLQARKHFCGPEQALARLETVLGLHNRLSAARDGVVPWPAPPKKIDDGYAPNWNQIALPVLAASLFLWSAHMFPVHPLKLGDEKVPISEPPELAQVQNWINALKADDLIEPEKLEEMQTALDRLHDRPPADWYTQDNLEAANSLKELTEQSMNALAQDLGQADASVQAMQEKAENLHDAVSLQPMQDQLRTAEENLASGNLPLNRELVQQLKNGEAATDKTLSASQLAALHERLKKGELAAQTAPKSDRTLSEEMQKAMADAAMGKGMGRRELEPGPGGLGGGKKSAPLELQARDQDTPEGNLTQVASDDMSRASLGDTVKVTASAHAVDPRSYLGTQTAGAAQVGGNGGEAVWRSTYDPQEADALDRFFK